MSEQATPNAEVQPTVEPEQEDDGITFDERSRKKPFKQVMKEPRMIAGLMLAFGVIGFVFYLEKVMPSATAGPA